MKIKNITISKLLSFGKEQKIHNLGKMNLFVGKNGTGKSNLIKILKGDIFSYENIKFIKDDRQYFLPKISTSKFHNNDSMSSDIDGIFKIEFYNKEAPIEFSFDDYGKFKYISGNPNVLIKNSVLIKLPRNNAEFKNTLVKATGNGRNLPTLNFGLFYIFGYHYRFNEQGGFYQGKNKQGGATEFNTNKLPSGVIQCSKIICEFLLNEGKEIIFIDEPELHLEPRSIRRLLNYIIFLNIRGASNKTHEERCIFDSLISIVSNNSNVCNGINRSIWAVETYALHDVMSSPCGKEKQIFIASHSSVMINEIIKMGEDYKLYEFSYKEYIYNELKVLLYEEPLSKYSGKKSTSALFTTVREINSNCSTLLEDLGVKGSDLLQTNGVIWVEGPSDAIYINKWLEMYSLENNKNLMLKGIDYDFIMSGGTLLDSYFLSDSDNPKKIINMLSFSRNSYVVIDSDAKESKNGKIKDISNFENAKNYINNQLHKLASKDGLKLGIWYHKDCTKAKTMENYLDEESLKYIKKSWSKKKVALELTKKWKKKTKLNEFPNNLETEIKKLYKCIESWSQ